MSTISSDWPRLQREAYTRLIAMPAEQSRKIALAQIDLVASRLADASGLAIHPRWKSYKEDIEEAREHLRIGDSQKDSTDEDGRKFRRRQYATAYLRARLIGRNLDDELKEGGTLQILVSDFGRFIVEVEQSAEKKIKEVVGSGGELIATVAIIAAVGLAAGIALKGGRRNGF